MSAGVCTMCEQEPATTTWFAPVCRVCRDWLAGIKTDLDAMEAADPELAELGRRVENTFLRMNGGDV